MLQELDDVAQPVSQLRGAAHVGQHAEEVRVRDPLAADVGEQVGVVGRLAQDDLGVVRVEVHLEEMARCYSNVQRFNSPSFNEAFQ